MDFLTYIADTARRQELADAVSRNAAYLWQIATGRRNAGFELAQKIEAHTNGVITKEMLRPDVWPTRASDRAETS